MIYGVVCVVNKTGTETLNLRVVVNEVNKRSMEICIAARSTLFAHKQEKIVLFILYAIL